MTKAKVRFFATLLLEQPYNFSLLLQVFEHLYRDSCFTGTVLECCTVPGGLPSKFTLSGKPYICLNEADVKQGAALK